MNCNLPRVADIQAALKKKAADTPEGMWVSGHMYDDTKLADGRPLNRRDIDAAVTSRAVLVVHRGGHTGVANSAAFAAAGVDMNTPDPEGGRFYRENGELTGKVAEHALDRMRAAVKRDDVTPDVRRRAVGFISAQMAKTGLTSVHSTGVDEFDLRALEEARDAGELRFRMYAFPLQPLFRKLQAAGIKTGFGDETIRIGPVKYIADGSASERTMRMSTPYVGRPNDYGILVIDQEQMNAQVEEAHRAGWRVGTHANGDVAIDMVLQAYERAQKQWPRADVRHRIEHCTLVNPGLLERIKAGGRHPGAVLHLRLLPRREVGRIRRREGALDVRAPVVPRLRHHGGPGVRLHARTLRAADGHPEHGHPHRLSGAGVGRQPEDHGPRGAQDLHHARSLRVTGRVHQGLDHARQARRLRDAREGPSHRECLCDQGHPGVCVPSSAGRATFEA